VAYLSIAVVVSAVGIAVVLWRHRARTPRSVDDSIDRFARARSALSPDARSRATRPASDAVRRDQVRRDVVSRPRRSDDGAQRAPSARHE
jgi:hypothetical protein